MNGIKLTVTGILFLVMALFLSAPAHAGLHHDHHYSVNTIFQKAAEVKPVHCLLRGHSISNPCPHILKTKSQRERTAIAPDCGGTPFSSKLFPLSPIQKISLNNANLIQKASLDLEEYFYSPDLYLNPISGSIDHPPKSYFI